MRNNTNNGWTERSAETRSRILIAFAVAVLKESPMPQIPNIKQEIGRSL